MEIREVLEEILKNYAENPGRVRLHPQIQGKVSGIQLKGRTMDGIFGLLLEAHGLSLMEDNKGPDRPDETVMETSDLPETCPDPLPWNKFF